MDLHHLVGLGLVLAVGLIVLQPVSIFLRLGILGRILLSLGLSVMVGLSLGLGLMSCLNVGLSLGLIAKA